MYLMGSLASNTAGPMHMMEKGGIVVDEDGEWSVSTMISKACRTFLLLNLKPSIFAPGY